MTNKMVKLALMGIMVLTVAGVVFGGGQAEPGETESGKLQPYQGDTDIFITPGFSFNIIDGLITNFHLPKSTLLMLVSALSSLTFIKNAYTAAVKERYRFFSYGDAMLIAE